MPKRPIQKPASRRAKALAISMVDAIGILAYSFSVPRSILGALEIRITQPAKPSAALTESGNVAYTPKTRTVLLNPGLDPLEEQAAMWWAVEAALKNLTDMELMKAFRA